MTTQKLRASDTHPSRKASVERAAKVRGWKFDETHGMFRDQTGRLIADGLTGEITIHYPQTPAVGSFW